jgi:hypothetical protein
MPLKKIPANGVTIAAPERPLLSALFQPSSAKPGDGHQDRGANIPERVHPFRIQPRLDLLVAGIARDPLTKFQLRRSQQFGSLAAEATIPIFHSTFRISSYETDCRQTLAGLAPPFRARLHHRSPI